jgi:competence protein ComFB
MEMEIHNITEDIVFNSVKTIFEVTKKKGNQEGFCLCDQCRLDTICYTLNRIKPRYIVSNRGMTRIEQDWVERQQLEADIATLVYKGLRQVNHNQRPTSSHTEDSLFSGEITNEPAFHIPTVIGRLFYVVSFAPVSGVTVTLRKGEEIVPMRNQNWQNPFTLIANTPGAFTFWPAPVPAETVGIHRLFEYSLRVESSQYEILTHFFKVATVSSLATVHTSYAQDRTFKLPDLYLFPPGEAEQNG